MAKIGFKHYQTEEEAPQKDENKKEQRPKDSPSKEQFRRFISDKYSPEGLTMDMIFRTSRELIYECREMCDVSLPDVAAVMTELGYQSQLFSGMYAWVLYEKELRFF